MKNFKTYVRTRFQRSGWNVQRIEDGIVDMKCTRGTRTMYVHVQRKGHGHIYGKLFDALLELEERTHADIAIAKVDSNNELVMMHMPKLKRAIEHSRGVSK